MIDFRKQIYQELDVKVSDSFDEAIKVMSEFAHGMISVFSGSLLRPKWTLQDNISDSYLCFVFDIVADRPSVYPHDPFSILMIKIPTSGFPLVLFNLSTFGDSSVCYNAKSLEEELLKIVKKETTKNLIALLRFKGEVRKTLFSS